jgi:hypothetical protein
LRPSTKPVSLRPAKCVHELPEGTLLRAIEEPDHRHRHLLRARREWPRRRCASEKRDELAPL